MAETSGLLNRRRVKTYRGFESPPVRHIDRGPVPRGGVAEWFKAAVLKTVEPRGSGGSNPSSSATLGQSPPGPLPQLEGPHKWFAGRNFRPLARVVRAMTLGGTRPVSVPEEAE